MFFKHFYLLFLPVITFFTRLYNLARSYYNHYVRYKNNNTKLTVILLTYNHAKTVENALKSILEQELDFKYQIIAADDASCDETADIIKKYAKKYPNIIKPLIREKNLGCPNNLFYARQLINTEYWVVLEGDDAFTNKHKLQMQFDIMNKHLNCVFCSHATKAVDLATNTEKYQVGTFETGKYLPSTELYVHTSSRFIRNIIDLKNRNKRILLRDISFIGLAMFYGKFYNINKVMSCYGITGSGIWTSLQKEAKVARLAVIYNILAFRFGSRFLEGFGPLRVLQKNFVALKKGMQNKKLVECYEEHEMKILSKRYNYLTKKYKIKQPIFTANQNGCQGKQLLTIKNKILLMFGNNYYGKLVNWLKKDLKTNNVLLFNSKLNALANALKLLNLPKGSEIITTPFISYSQAKEITLNGYKLVFADINSKTPTICPKSIQKLVNKNTSAILAINTFGYPCDFVAIEDLAKLNNLKVIYDGVDGAKSLLSYGDVVLHNLGELGAEQESACCLITKHKSLQQIASEEHENNSKVNVKTSNKDALVVLQNLKKCKKETKERLKVYSFYQKKLKGVEGISLPSLHNYKDSGFKYFPLKVNEDYCIELKETLAEYNICAHKYLNVLCSDFSDFKESKKDGNLINASAFTKQELCIPINASVAKNALYKKILLVLRHYLAFKNLHL